MAKQLKYLIVAQSPRFKFHYTVAEIPILHAFFMRGIVCRSILAIMAETNNYSKPTSISDVPLPEFEVVTR